MRTVQAERVSVLGRIWRIAWSAAFAVVCIASLALIVAWKVYGYMPMAVLSGSMEPSMPTGALAFAHEVSPGSVHTGDIITFTPPGRSGRISHRVVSRELRNGSWFFVTKGDANPTKDDWTPVGGVPASKRALPGVTYGRSRPAIRVEWNVPYLGWIVRLQSVPWLRQLLIIMPLAAIMFGLVARIWMRPGHPSEIAAPIPLPRPDVREPAARQGAEDQRDAA
jgi:signal peptidase I